MDRSGALMIIPHRSRNETETPAQLNGVRIPRSKRFVNRVPRARPRLKSRHMHPLRAVRCESLPLHDRQDCQQSVGLKL